MADKIKVGDFVELITTPRIIVNGKDVANPYERRKGKYEVNSVGKHSLNIEIDGNNINVPLFMVESTTSGGGKRRKKSKKKNKSKSKRRSKHKRKRSKTRRRR